MHTLLFRFRHCRQARVPFLPYGLLPAGVTLLTRVLCYKLWHFVKSYRFRWTVECCPLRVLFNIPVGYLGMSARVVNRTCG
jgi:hypothetical protein